MANDLLVENQEAGLFTTSSCVVEQPGPGVGPCWLFFSPGRVNGVTRLAPGVGDGWVDSFMNIPADHETGSECYAALGSTYDIPASLWRSESLVVYERSLFCCISVMFSFCPDLGHKKKVRQHRPAADDDVQ